MAVKESITLEGAEQVKKAWQDVGQAGEQALSQLRSAGQNFGNVVVKFGSDNERATESVNKQSGAARGLRDVFRSLNPIVRQAGGSIAEFAAFSRIAAIGVVGLAAAITGSVLVALAKLSDSSDLARNRLDELLQSKDLGSRAFDELDKGARKLGTSTANLAPAFEAARNALQSLGANRGFVGSFIPGGNVEDQIKVVVDLISIIRRSTGDSKTASAALVAFFNAAQSAGVVTKESFDALRKQSPGAVNAIAQAFALGQVSTDDWLKSLDKAPIKLDDIFKKMALFKSLNPQAFDVEPVNSFGAALERMQRRFDDILKRFTGRDINKFLADFIDEATKNQGREFELIGQLIVSLKAGIIDAFNIIRENAKGLFDQIVAIFSVNPFTVVADAFSAMLEDFVNKARDVWNRIKQIFSEPLNVIANIFSSSPSGGSVGSDSGEGFAGGGLFRGRPGRDTNLAWLSDLEYVMRPEAVRRYGVGFMHAINNMRLPLDQLRGFSLGGLVEGLGRSIPAFATGGLNTGPGQALAPVHLHLPGGGTISGLLAPEETANQIIRYGLKRGRASGGRAPTWVGIGRR